MHCLRSHGVAIRFRLAALALVCNLVCLMGSIGVLAYAHVMDDRRLAIFGIFGLLGGMLLILVTWMLSSRANCPLCMMPVMVNKRCCKHGRARTVFGSYRLRVALAILFRGAFNCPYCMEPTAVRVRQRGVMARGRSMGVR